MLFAIDTQRVQTTKNHHIFYSHDVRKLISMSLFVWIGLQPILDRISRKRNRAANVISDSLS